MNKENKTKEDSPKWTWKDDPKELIDLIMWVLVYERVGKEGKEGWTEIIKSPELVKENAKQFGMTRKAIAEEIVRCGNAYLSGNYEKELGELIEDLCEAMGGGK